MKRNLINEITAIKSRTEFYSRYDLSTRLNDIENAFKENLIYNAEFDKELLKYFPVATIACFEAFFRSVIKELIDFGKPYSDNAIKFNQSKNVKFDFEIINAIQSKTVSVGEFVSHILPYNNFEDINSSLSTIAEIDFVKEIKNFQRKGSLDGDISSPNDFVNNCDQIIADIKRTFELRHIFCHEFATNINIDKDEILRCFKNSKIFLNQTNDFIRQLIYPNAPETQVEMNIDAHETFLKVEEEMMQIILTIKDATRDNVDMMLFNPELFDQTIDEWKKYREIKAKYDAFIAEGGSLYAMIYSNSLTITTKEKIESLRNEFAYDIRKHSRL